MTRRMLEYITSVQMSFPQEKSKLSFLCFLAKFSEALPFPGEILAVFVVQILASKPSEVWHIRLCVDDRDSSSLQQVSVPVYL